MKALIPYLVTFLCGNGLGAYLWNKYSAKVAADLAAVQKKI
jgi:hypothetical protein